ncbi:MAG: mevalonate kinase [Candidatus Heimdallarchaeaceae archaeon]
MPRQNISSCSAPGKIILFGEHAVVYGYPAIALAIDKRVYCRATESSHGYATIKSINFEEGKTYVISDHQTLPKSFLPLSAVISKLINTTSKKKLPALTIESELPASSGLGSSAATAVALIQCLSSFYKINLSLDDICKYAFEAEKIQHGTPSGIDNTISTYGGGIYFKQGDLTRLNISLDATIVVADSNIPRSTRELVEKVRVLRKKEPFYVDEILKQIGDIVEEGKRFLLSQKIEQIGYLMTKNHYLLEKLGVGHKKLNAILNILHDSGALGGKLTGAGGGGCVIALFADKNEAERAINKLKKQYSIKAFGTTVSTQGVICETRINHNS